MNYVIGQNLDGKWLLKDISSKKDKKGYPGFQLLEIQDSSVTLFKNFTLDKRISNLTITKDKILNENKTNFGEFRLINKNLLKLYVDGKSNNKDVVFECDYFLLEPTNTNLTINEIEELKYFINDNGKAQDFSFNNENDSVLRKIERIDSTLFVTMYSNQKRVVSYPIKEVDENRLVMYRIPTIDYKIIAVSKR